LNLKVAGRIMWMNIADIVDPKKILDDDLNAPYHEINEPNEFAVWIA
jgi:hypothetical protein